VKILLFTRFFPNIGGIETGSQTLAREWSEAGQEVTVATDVPLRGVTLPDYPFRVIHQPSWRVLLSEVEKCDLFILFNIRLKSIWPGVIWPSKLIATHHGFYWIDRNGTRDWRERLKVRVARRLVNIAVSNAIAREIGARCHVIPPPYNKKAFSTTNLAVRSREFVFVGRLVSDKGADVALRALAKLKGEGLRPRLTIIGDGEERQPLILLAQLLGISDQVLFTGSIPTADVAARLNDHEILLVPSLWKEPFGLVAIEGIACGCVVIGSKGGGLPEAIGPCGITFPNGDVELLAQCMRELLLNPGKRAELRTHAADHLARHDPATVAREYLRVFERALRRPHQSRSSEAII